MELKIKRLLIFLMIVNCVYTKAQYGISNDSLKTLFYQKYMLRNELCSTRKININEKIAEHYIQNGDFKTAQLIYAEILPCLSDSMRKTRELDLISLDIANGDYDLAQSKLIEYIYLEKNCIISGRANLLLGVTYLLENNDEQANKYLNSGLLILEKNPQLIDSIRVVLKQKKKVLKHPTGAVLLSTILPGSGQLYGRNIEGAIGGFGLNVSLLYLFVRAVQSDRFYSAGVVLIWPWQRYYRGNLKSTKESIQHYNELVEDRFNLEILRLIKQYR